MTSEHAPPRVTRLFSTLALAIVATLGLLYIVSQFLRNSVGVIAPDLAAEVGLSPMQLGASVQHLLLRLCRDAVAARRRPGPVRPETVHAGVDRLHGGGLRAVRAGGRRRGLDRKPRAARLRHRELPDGAGRALCALVPAGAVFHARRHPSRHRLARRAVCDRAACLCHCELRLARDLPRRRRHRARDRHPGLADRQRRPAGRDDRAQARDPA